MASSTLEEVVLRLNTEIPQWLKPSSMTAGYGTAEAVPLQGVRSSWIIQMKARTTWASGYVRSTLSSHVRRPRISVVRL